MKPTTDKKTEQEKPEEYNNSNKINADINPEKTEADKIEIEEKNMADKLKREIDLDQLFF